MVAVKLLALVASVGAPNDFVNRVPTHVGRRTYPAQSIRISTGETSKRPESVLCTHIALKSRRFVEQGFKALYLHRFDSKSNHWSNLYSSGESARVLTSRILLRRKSSMMKAAVRAQTRKIVFSNNEPIPLPGSKRVRLRVMAASVNPIDYKFFKMSLGKYVGMDVAGIVDAVGSGVDNFFVGDEVFGIIDVGQSGSIAEYCICKADALHLTHKPKNLAWDKAAGSVVTYVTAYGALTDSSKAGMRQGDSVLIIGASGGCGLAGVQLAKALKASEIVGVCSSANHDLVLRNGATRCVDYRDQDAYAKMIQKDKFDVIFDTVTGSAPGINYWPDGRKLLKPDRRCRHVCTSSTYLQLFASLFGLTKRQKSVFMDMNHIGSDLQTIYKLLGNTIDTQFDRIVFLTEQGVKEAFERMASTRTTGKIVFSLRNAGESTDVSIVRSE